MMSNSTENFGNKYLDNQGVDISFKNVTYSVEIAAEKSQGFTLPCLQKTTKKPLLNNISGIFKAGEVTAIMGASGAGKTTLLNVLACRVSLENQEGEILANNINYNYEMFGDFANYVMQADVLLQTLTVRETLKFAADLKLNATEEEKIFSINKLAKSLKL
jgi:ABC-type multidrug transport system ATPase subunit